MKWLYGILCLFFLILFHEFGHFVAAKIFRVKVESFSIGFGPVLFHKKIGETDFRLSLIPLGGYCGMKGEKELQTALENGTEITSEKDSLFGIHPLKRALVGFAGPFFNYIFSVIAFALVAGIGYSYYSYSNKIILADEKMENACTKAREAGILSGDKIIKVGNSEIESFSDLSEAISIRGGETTTIIVDRNGEILSFTAQIELDKSTGAGKLGVMAENNSLIQLHTPHYNFFQAIGQGFKESAKMIHMTFKGISVLFKGVEIKNAVSGPARVTEMLGSTVKDGFSMGAKIGFISILDLMALISISLFIMNLLPIPILDGGLILFALIEAIIKKHIPVKIQYYTQYIGLAFIALLLMLGLTGDVNYFVNMIRGK